MNKILKVKDNMDSIYFDHNAGTPVDPSVLEEMLPFFGKKFGNPHSSSHEVGWNAAKAVDTAVGAVAELIGSDSDEVFFTSGATESNNIAVFGLTTEHKCIRNKILTTEIEHKSTINICRILSGEGYETVFVPIDGQGRIDPNQLKQVLDDQVLLCTFGAVNSEIGTIQPIKQIADIVRSFGAYMHWDAAQAPESIPINALSQSADLISLSAHKMYGPQGIGAVYIRREIQDRIISQ